MNTWNHARFTRLSARLAEVRRRLEALAPQLVQVQVNAVKGMAEVVKAASSRDREVQP